MRRSCWYTRGNNNPSADASPAACACSSAVISEALSELILAAGFVV